MGVGIGGGEADGLPCGRGVATSVFAKPGGAGNVGVAYGAGVADPDGLGVGVASGGTNCATSGEPSFGEVAGEASCCVAGSAARDATACAPCDSAAGAPHELSLRSASACSPSSLDAAAACAMTMLHTNARSVAIATEPRPQFEPNNTRLAVFPPEQHDTRDAHDDVGHPSGEDRIDLAVAPEGRRDRH